MNSGSKSDRSSRQRPRMRKEDADVWRIDEHSKPSCMCCARASNGTRYRANWEPVRAVHDRFQEWEQAGFFKALWQAGLYEYDDLQGIQWEWQAVDGVMTKAPFGNAATGANPTDRGKRGTKRSLLTDGAGIPLAVVVDGANRHDVKLLSATLDGLVISRPDPTVEQPQHLCLDAAYASTPVDRELLARQYQPHVRSRGEEQREKESIPGYRARKWVVERSHSWINRSRRLLVRWEKKVENYLAFLHLACAQLIFAKVAVFG